MYRLHLQCIAGSLRTCISGIYNTTGVRTVQTERYEQWKQKAKIFIDAC